MTDRNRTKMFDSLKRSALFGWQSGKQMISLRWDFISLCSADSKRAVSLRFEAQTVSLSLSLLLPCRGAFRARRAGCNCSTPPSSAAQRYNTLDFVPKVVCHETPARFLWILPAQRADVLCRPCHEIRHCVAFFRKSRVNRRSILKTPMVTGHRMKNVQVST